MPTLPPACLKRWAGIALLLGALGGCAIATPYREVGQAPADASADAALVAITEARLGGDRASRAAFWDGVREVERSLPSQPGLLGYALRRELLGNTAWTMTVWDSEEALDRFVGASAHRSAMAAGDPAIASVRFARLTRARDAGPPPWPEALDALARRGQGYR
ncbi:antibiotic biosynthesis monooxygenase [Elioraea sp.]|uniref:antibiotic biosynthesis monooxygenase family protein n=1 Tax=Elioraea sp. TaxID=2185103 RepID=UPI0025C11B44|nr:antibiotic biosynthesis monooxygenase family protein [Elioraea sp.]